MHVMTVDLMYVYGIGVVIDLVVFFRTKLCVRAGIIGPQLLANPNMKDAWFWLGRGGRLGRLTFCCFWEVAPILVRINTARFAPGL